MIDHAFVLPDPAEAWASLILAAPGTSWATGDAAVISIEVDGQHRQELVLAGGGDRVEYTRSLGRLEAGDHVLSMGAPRMLSGAPAAPLDIAAVHAGGIPKTHPVARVWASAPILHYRDDHGPAGAATDTPLAVFYRRAARRAGGEVLEGIEYHVVFSHEDAGTDLTGLLARWGHTVDIEWVFRVVWDHAGAVVAEEFQGPRHRATAFHGDRAWGSHPVLQIIGRHGMVTDRVEHPDRVALAPVAAQPDGEPREGVLHRFPWIYRVSALEVVRQIPLEPVPRPSVPAPADPRAYLFLQWTRRPRETGAFEARAEAGGTWYRSSFGRPDLAFRGPDAESTAIKLPERLPDDAVTAIAVRALVAPEEPVELHLVRAFRLGDDYRPMPPLASGGSAILDAPGTWVTAWERTPDTP